MRPERERGGGGTVRAGWVCRERRGVRGRGRGVETERIKLELENLFLQGL